MLWLLQLPLLLANLFPFSISPPLKMEVCSHFLLHANLMCPMQPRRQNFQKRCTQQNMVKSIGKNSTTAVLSWMCPLPMSLLLTLCFFHYDKIPSLSKVVSRLGMWIPHMSPPKGKVGGDLIEAVFRLIRSQLMKETIYYDFTSFGVVDTVKNLPLINIVASGDHNPGCVLEEINYHEHMSEGDKKMSNMSLNKLFL